MEEGFAMESMNLENVELNRSNNQVEIEDHLRHYSPVHPKYFFVIFRTFFLASFFLFSAFLM